MKHTITFMLTALLLLTGLTSWGQNRDEVAYTLEPIAGSNNSYTGNCDIEIDGITWNLTGNSQMIPWRIGGKSITEVDRNLYSKTAIAESISQIEIEHGTASGITVNSMTLTVALNSDFTDPVSVIEGEFVASSTTTFVKPEDTDWTNMYYKITYNVTVSGSSNKFIQFVGAVFYTGEGGQTPETVATPTFSPDNGTYFEPQSVTISCTTEDASIYYTIDGTDPDESSSLYSVPVTISETTTLKAKAFKSGFTASSVASATYTFPTLMTIAEAKTLDDNQYALVQGIVTFIEGKNVYIQDNTGGIDLFLNANASGVVQGDEVKAYGKKTVYNGLVELKEINQSSSAFNILSSGNTLPLAVKTIAEVLAGGAGDLQCTRVKIESATIGAINTSGNTPLAQGENSTNIYKIPALTDIEEGDEVDVIGVIGYYNAPQIRVANAADVVIHVNPQLSVSVTELTGFQYTFQDGPSEAQSITVTGSDLLENVTVTATENFEVSTTSDGTYSNTLNLTPADGVVSQTLYVRMKAGLSVDSYTGSISLTCGELIQSVTLSGTVSEQPIAEAPTFSPAEGTFLVGQTVTISTTTADATIYYTLDDTDPTESDAVYSTPIEVNATTTIKAMAAASGYANSAIATATYTIHEPITIAEAHALEANEYACVEGVVTFIDGRNVYVQDESAGIVLYLNNNTVPSDLAISDKVRAYGKRATYNGLIELSAINGGNDNEFTILSTSNPLPLAIKTIAEINEDFAGNNLLQSTRLKIQDAIIGAINTSGNTPIMQDGNSLNIYHIPTVDGLVEGDIVTVVGILGCYNTPQLRVLSAGDVQYAHRPTISATPTSLSGMTYDYVDGGPSEITSFELSGSTLSGPVSIYPSESFEVSTLGGDLFVSENPTMVFSPIDFSGINVYVRMKANLEPGTYTEQIYGVSEGADTLFVSVSGTVVGEDPTPPTPPTPPTEDGYVRISDLSDLVEGSYVVFAARFDENASDYYAMSNTASGKPTGVLFTSEISGDNEVLPATITDEENNYYWIVGITVNGYTFTNANGELIGYTSSTNFATGGNNIEWSITNETSGEGTMVPNYTGFVITNVNNDGRAFALNNSYNFGPYAKSNMAGAQAGNYNFYLDLFVKTEGIEPPTPVVATPTFTPDAGTYYEEQTVSIACTTEDATIHYTLDGSDPTEESPVYGAPLTISETTTIKAIAMKEGYDNSAIAEATYNIQLGVVVIFNQDWEGEMNGWTFVDVEGDMNWAVASFQGNHYANANGHNHGANEDWCISPAFNLDAYDNPVLTFRTAMNFTGNDLEVFFSNDYDGEDPTTATWTALTCELSTGSYTWVESGAIDLSSYSGSECYIGFKYTCTEETAAAWEVDDILLVGQTSAPVVTVTPLALTGFTYIEGNGPSAEQSFIASGLNLSANITITEAADFEISLASGNDFEAQSTITLAPSNGNVEETTIYVRMKADLEVGEYTEEDITVACDDVDDIMVTCSGSVTEAPMPGGDYVRISNVGELVAGNRVILAARFNENVNDYRAIANTLSGGKPATTEFTSMMDGDNEIVSADILADESSYYWTLDIDGNNFTFTNADGDVIGYGSNTNFNMNGEKTAWTIQSGVSDEASLVPDYNGFNITNVGTDTRAFALRFNNDAYTCGAYSTSNMTGGQADQYNFFLDIFMQGEGGVPPTPTVAAPSFDPAGGTYYEAQEVTLSCTTEGATIYYSLESEEGPWTEYEGSILIDENMTIWAYSTMEGYNDSPVVSAEYIIQAGLIIIFNQDWEDDWNGWTEVSVLGDTTNWTIAEHNGNHYAYMNAHNQGENEDWLISPAFDLTTYPDAVLTFVTARNYNGPDIEVFFSNDYDGEDPTTATWEPLTCELSTGSWNWTESGEIYLEGFEGSNCYIAFKYTSTEDTAAAWEVDDIMLVSGGEPPIPTPNLTATPNIINGLDYMEGEGPSESQSYTLTAANLEGEGYVTVTASEGFEISLDDEEYDVTLEIAFANGELEDQPVTIYVRLVEGLEAGVYEGTITHEGGNASVEVGLYGTVHSENEPALDAFMPLYIQGNNGTNNNRVPVAIAVYVENLEPNTTYRYTNQFVVEDDEPTTAGAGNVIYANEDGFYRSTSPSLSTEGGYGEFTTDEEGIGFAWFMNEATANTRFTPGNQVYLRIRLNNGHDGTTVAYTLTTEDYATVLNFGNGADEYSGSAFYAKSDEAPMSFAMMFSNDEDWRPTYSTPIETTGVDYGSINQYTDFYKEEVAGKNGWFGGILPNDNESGINVIWILDMESYVINDYYTEDGIWAPETQTANPNVGLDEPIFIDLTYDDVAEIEEANVKVWNTDHEFVIENGDNAHYMMTVYNILGQPMMTKQINAGSTERISHSLANGLYVISLQNNLNKVSVKVIVR